MLMEYTKNCQQLQRPWALPRNQLDLLKRRAARIQRPASACGEALRPAPASAGSTPRAGTFDARDRVGDEAVTRFSANLGFLWADRPLPDAIRAVHAAGFAAVECHWPYDVPAGRVAAALAETGLPMLGLNTRRGLPGENGLAALPGREAKARAEIDRAIAYARAVGCGAVHVMSGIAAGPAAAATLSPTSTTPAAWPPISPS